MITPHDLEQHLGFSDKEARVYYALLQEGSGYASNIATVAGVKRSTAYQVLEQLHSYGVVLKYVKGKKLFFAPAKPRSLEEFLTHQEEDLARKKKYLNKDILPELNLFFAHKQKKPRLVFFEKKDEVFKLFIDMLKPRGNEEVIGFVSLDELVAQGTPALFKNMAKALQENHIALKLINYDDKTSAQKTARLWISNYFKNVPQAYRPVIKTVHEKHDMHSAVFVTAHKTYLMDVTPPEYMGTVISNQDMAQAFSIMFNNLWESIQ